MTMTPEQTLQKMDRMLAAEEELLPSSGFVAAVMDRVREEAVAPEPIAFPWKRTLPGALVVAIGLVFCSIELVRMSIAAAATPQLLLQLSKAMTLRVESIAYVAVVLGISALSWLFARRIVGSRNLV